MCIGSLACEGKFALLQLSLLLSAPALNFLGDHDVISQFPQIINVKFFENFCWISESSLSTRGSTIAQISTALISEKLALGESFEDLGKEASKAFMMRFIFYWVTVICGLFCFFDKFLVLVHILSVQRPVEKRLTKPWIAVLSNLNGSLLMNHWSNNAVLHSSQELKTCKMIQLLMISRMEHPFLPRRNFTIICKLFPFYAWGSFNVFPSPLWG